MRKKNAKNNRQKNDKNISKKLINISIIQVSFMYILKISAIKSIKISVTIITKITDRNAGMRDVLNWQV